MSKAEHIQDLGASIKANNKDEDNLPQHDQEMDSFAYYFSVMVLF